MNTIHRTAITAQCPHGGTDFYKVEFHVGGQFKAVEDIIKEIHIATVRGPIYQEDLTQLLADRLRCRVTTTGQHGQFQTECVADPQEGA